MTPKENPEAKAERERERRLAQKERRRATEELASGLTSDLRSVYGMSLFK